MTQFDFDDAPGKTMPLELIAGQFEKAAREEDDDLDFSQLDVQLRGEAAELEKLAEPKSESFLDRDPGSILDRVAENCKTAGGAQLAKSLAKTGRRLLLGNWLHEQVEKGCTIQSLADHARSNGDGRTADLILAIASSEGLI